MNIRQRLFRNMWNHQRMLLLFAVTLLLTFCQGFLNIEELEGAKYTLDILNKPLSELEINLMEGLKLASRHGQTYYCKLPNRVKKLSEKEEEKIPPNSPITSLLEPMKQEACLKTLKGWWTYEFCYGKYIRQYHTEGDVIKGETTYLGYYESDFDWNKEVLDESSNFKRHKFNRYHSQSYVNGTSCDVINHKRDTEIRYFCDESSLETYIERVDEPSTCSYIITIRTPYICPHPHTKPLHNPKPVEIMCSPLLSAEDYNKYEEMKAAVENQEVAEQRMVETKPETHDSDDVDQGFYGQVLNMFEALLPQKKDEQAEDKNAKDALKKSQVSEKMSSKEIEEAEAIKMIERFVVKQRLQNMEQFHQKRLVMDVVDLMKIYEHLPTADRARIIESHVSKVVATIEDLARTDVEAQEYQDKMLNSLNNKLMDEITKIPLPESDEVEEEKEKKSSKPVSVHVRVHKIKTTEDFDDIKPDELVIKEAEDAAEYDPAWKKIEEDISKGLEDAGFETTENHIEIRLITNKENIGEAVRIGSEEGERFRQMLLELVAGGTAVTKEVRKQKALHENYNLIWEKGSSSFTSLSNFEEENDETETRIKSPKL